MSKDGYEGIIWDLSLSGIDISRLSTEDKILVTLFKEKGATKGELVKYLKNTLYPAIREAIANMEFKGYVIARDYDALVYYLTRPGVYELQYRMNRTVFDSIHTCLEEMGYDRFNVINFIRNRFYLYYLDSPFVPETIEEQYIDWCKSNELEPKSPAQRRLEP